MNIRQFIWVAAFCLGLPLSAVDWKAETLKAERWTKNSSGTMIISEDPEEENALRFETEIKQGKDCWIYPVFKLGEGESLEGAAELQFEIKAATAEKPKFACVMIDKKMLKFPVPGAQWKRVRISLQNIGIDLKKVKEFRIGFNPANPGKSIFWIRNFQIFDRKTVEKATPVFLAAEGTAPSNVFYDSEPVEFKLKDGHRLPCSFRVEDAFGREVAAGQWPGNGHGILMLKNLPRGYYTLMLDNKKKYAFREPMSFAIVSDVSKKKPASETAFAVDTAQSWLASAHAHNKRFPHERYERISELCRRAGFGFIRDRISWRHIESVRGNFAVSTKYMHNAKLLADRGISICTTFSQMPKWTDPQKEIPNDLFAVYKSSKQIAEIYRGKIAAYEFMNEPDMHYEGPAWLLAAATKAFFLGVKETDPDIKVLNSSFSVSPLQQFALSALKSGIGQYIDIFNYHVYSSLSDYSWTVARLRSEMAKFGIQDMPIWLTEVGTNDDGNAAVDSYLHGRKVHSFRQEMIVAEFVPKSQILMQSLGVSRTFFFVMPPFWENAGRKDWGLLHPDMTVKAAYVSFAALNAELSNARLLGTLELAENVCGFLYEQPDGSQTLAFWSKSRLEGYKYDGKDRKFRLKLPNGCYRVSNLFGTPSQVRSENGSLELTASRYPSYLSGFSGLTATVPFSKPASAAPISSEKYDRSIILKPVLGKNFKIASNGAYADLLSIPGKLTLEVYNFSAEPKSGVITMNGGKVIGLPKKVTLSPYSKVNLPLEVTPDFQGGYQVDLIFSGSFGDRKISPAAVPLIQVETVLKTPNKGKELDWRNPSRWRANSSGKMEISFDKKEQAMKLKTVFAPGSFGGWIFPEYMLNLPNESLKDAIGVVFDIKAGPEVRSGIGYTALIAVFDTVLEKGKSYWIRYPRVSDKWERRFVVFGCSEPADIKMLRIGMCPKCNDFTYYIRNVRSITASKKQ